MDDRFNAKISTYADGTTYIRLYDGYISTKDSDKRDTDPNLRKKGKEKTEYALLMEEWFGKLIDVQAQEESLRCSVSRTRRCIRDYAHAMEWQWFATFTLAPEYDRTDYKKLSRRLRNWFNNQRKKYGLDNLAYLIVLEPHADDISWHAHALIANTDGSKGNMRFENSGKKYYSKDGKKRTVYNLPEWRYGFTNCTQVIDNNRVGWYISKYITKSNFNAMPKGSHRYLKSSNLKKPSEKRLLLTYKEKADFAEKYAAATNTEIINHRDCNGYIKLEYYELK